MFYSFLLLLLIVSMFKKKAQMVYCVVSVLPFQPLYQCVAHDPEGIKDRYLYIYKQQTLTFSRI